MPSNSQSGVCSADVALMVMASLRDESYPPGQTIDKGLDSTIITPICRSASGAAYLPGPPTYPLEVEEAMARIGRMWTFELSGAAARRGLSRFRLTTSLAAIMVA